MTPVVSLPTVIAQEAHRVVCREILRIFADKLLDGVPQGRNRLDVLVEGDCEAIHLALVLHDQEWVVGNVTEELDRRLDAPVVIVARQQWVTVKELQGQA